MTLDYIIGVFSSLSSDIIMNRFRQCFNGNLDRRLQRFYETALAKWNIQQELELKDYGIHDYDDLMRYISNNGRDSDPRIRALFSLWERETCKDHECASYISNFRLDLIKASLEDKERNRTLSMRPSRKLRDIENLEILFEAFCPTDMINFCIEEPDLLYWNVINSYDAWHIYLETIRPYFHDTELERVIFDFYRPWNEVMQEGENHYVSVPYSPYCRFIGCDGNVIMDTESERLFNRLSEMRRGLRTRLDYMQHYISRNYPEVNINALAMQMFT